MVAEPVIDAAFDKIDNSNVAYLYVGVGGRAFWKDPNCIFRTNQDTRYVKRGLFKGNSLGQWNYSYVSYPPIFQGTKLGNTRTGQKSRPVQHC